MASQRSLRESEWDVAALHWPHGQGQCVFRRGRGGWEPWVVVARSAVLHRVRRDGLGLYASRPFRRDEYWDLTEELGSSQALAIELD